MVVMGIDPGSQRTGWGVVTDTSGVLRLLGCGIVRTNAKDSFPKRLATIYRSLREELERYTPDEGAIEQVFTAHNVQSALKLGQARGVAVAACAAVGCPVYDYEPTAVKKAVVGVGRAEKEQVAFMVRRLLCLDNDSLALDTTDALGVAICHLTQTRIQHLAQRVAGSKFQEDMYDAQRPH